eukprot:6038688-Ditylum_brightwellii.AAC.1
MPGNALEFNALDSNFNHNIHCTVLEHVSYTASLHLTNKQQFSVGTVKQQDRAYLRLWDPELQQRLGWEAGVPSLKRILEDMAQIAEYFIPKRYSVRG